ncbi:MOSC N-terminal beta barrel domain-containing protein [Rhodoferax sp.]|uniref:MOSC domain-containing protein n=1 Tax=Rhodoferax sp. TaxID=50421 RepID=UPI0025DAA6D1|nr:MOSC N-terminal beta barrel domain-containing protein [Rhodoferax sp.]
MPANFSPDATGHIAALMVYPVKSLAGIALAQARLLETGLEWDRHWMVVDARGLFVTQREIPRMALVQPHLQPQALELHCPGWNPLSVAFSARGERTRVQVWDDALEALDTGDEAATWLQQVLQHPGLRLVRFAPEVTRPCSTRWTQGVPSRTEFADGYPVLVTTEASLVPLNARLSAAACLPVDMRRFRPNLVLGGFEVHDEDHMARLQVEVGPESAPAQLALVKPCARCPIPNVDPATGESHPGVGDALQAYRRDARLNGAITFGMNGIVESGAGQLLRVGQVVAAVYGFD